MPSRSLQLVQVPANVDRRTSREAVRGSERPLTATVRKRPLEATQGSPRRNHSNRGGGAVHVPDRVMCMLRARLDFVFAAALCSLVAPGCEESSDGNGGLDGEEGVLPSGSSDSVDSTSDDSSASSTGEKLDVDPSSSSDDDACPESGDCDECEAPEHQPCDTDASNIITAMGLNCPGEPIVTATVGGAPAASGTLSSFGNTTAFNPTEGQRYAVIGSGFVADLPIANGLLECSQDVGAFDPGTNLAAPIVPMDVGGGGCAADPGLVGTGDCSNTIQTQFQQAAAGAFDPAKVRQERARDHSDRHRAARVDALSPPTSE